MEIMSKEESNEEERILEERVDKLRNEAWKALGFSGEPTMICIYCRIPCNWDKHNDIISCKKCGSDWTLESMKDQCERLVGIKK